MKMSTRFHMIQGEKLAVSRTGASRFRNRYRAQPRQSNREFIPIVLFAALAMFCGVWSWTGQGATVSRAAIISVSSFASDTQSASFGFCDTGGGSNCVVDGDTLYYQGTKVRIADIDTPETHPSRCAAEARLGDAATRRLHNKRGHHKSIILAKRSLLAGNHQQPNHFIFYKQRRRQPRPIWIIYAKDRRCLDAAIFLKVVVENPAYCIYRSVAPDS